MNQDYADICSRCKQPCTRVKVRLNSGVPCYLTSCCGVAPVAVRKET